MRRENGSATESSEDYLEVIFVIRQESGRCRNVDIAERMGVTKPSVTKALARLSAQSLVKVVGRDVRLTQKGLGVARATLDKHEFFKRLLCDAGVDARLAAREACRMEHCLSEDFFQRLAAYLGNRQDEGDSG